MKLMVEINEALEFIEEANSSGTKDHYIKGIFMQAEQKNRNVRVYQRIVPMASSDIPLDPRLISKESLI